MSERITAKQYRERIGLADSPPNGGDKKPKAQIQNENHPDTQLQSPKPKRHKKATLGAANEREAESVQRAVVRFIGYRVRPLDPDNHAGGCKDLLDGLRHAGLIQGDEHWRVILETEQVKVATYAEEKTIIEILTN